VEIAGSGCENKDGEPEGKRQLETQRHRWEDNIILDNA
jgi:hypothetical protein